MDKEKTIQIKFTVNEEQYKKLEILAKMRELSVPQFCKLTSLQVKMQSARPIVVNDEYVMSEPDVLLMKEVEERYNVENQFLKIDKEFNERLYEYAVKQTEGK
ncbi:Uncharacterised protein [Streptococcus pneumoniae]|mgnify:FL=1|uniref:hypothetical protein n=1 Tax=Bacteria TaxID=2 RepID=UPI0005E42574|nr:MULTISPECIES: hypothetical protein [Bacilli]RXC10986.1 hypothetical protein EPS84_24855 [Escherichia coli]HDR8026637.1 hypothetical protein [Bacillus cereus]MDA1829776.1 hypothetical protein [Bacillus cereus group sp. BY25LC]CEV85245.1 Uncharacterised protein [Streptococcus pneumoniae]CGG57517.1 Uncharacterised protein [Streptococcus pneumoniae]